MNILDIIAKKRDKNELTKEEIEYFIKEYTIGNVTDYQAAALVMAIYINGMNEQEIIYCGDDYCEGGNDYDVYVGGIPFVKVDHYDRLGETLQDDGLL